MSEPDLQVIVASAGVIVVRCKVYLRDKGIEVKSWVHELKDTDLMAATVLAMCASAVTHNLSFKTLLDNAIDIYNDEIEGERDPIEHSKLFGAASDEG